MNNYHDNLSGISQWIAACPPDDDGELLAVAREILHQHFPDCAPLRIGETCGIAWALLASPAVGVNGYVLIPAEGHPWSGGLPAGFDRHLDVHGGLTYQQFPIIGFDTGHGYDYWPPEYDPIGVCATMFRRHHPDWIYWTVDMVEAETRQLARQIAAQTTPSLELGGSR